MFILESFLNYILFMLFDTTRSFGISIIFLSIIVNIILIPFYFLAKKLENKEHRVQKQLQPRMARIKAIKNGAVRHKQLQHLYKAYSYSPLYSLSSLSSLIIQIPFFIAAYRILSVDLHNVVIPFWFIPDLTKPDALFFGMNLLPLLMTGINIISTMLVPDFTDKDRKQAYILAVFFLVLLYNSSSALVLYWTCNNIISLLRNVLARLKAADQTSPLDINGALSRIFNPVAMGPYLCFLAVYFAIKLYFTGYPLSLYLDAEAKIANTDATLFLLICLVAIFCKSYMFINGRTNPNKAVLVSGTVTIVLFAGSLAITRTNGFVLLACIFILGLLNINSFKTKDISLGRSIFMVMLVTLPLLLLYLLSNWVYFTNVQMVFYFVVVLALAVAVHLLVFFSNKPVSLERTTWLSMAFVAAFMFLPLVRQMVYYNSATSVDFLFVFAVFIFIFSLFQNKTKLLLVFVSVATIYLAGATIFHGARLYLDDQRQRDAIIEANAGFAKMPEAFKNLEMKAKPNVYFIIYDSLPRKEVLTELGEDPAILSGMLAHFGFTVYDDIYSIMPTSLLAVAGIYDVKRTDYSDPVDLMRINAGYSFVNHTFMYNDYYTIVANPSMYMEGKFQYVDEYLEFDSVVSEGRRFKLVNEVLLGLAQGTLNSLRLNFSNQVFTAENYTLLSKYVERKDDRPTFIRTHYYLPGHGDNQQVMQDQKPRWIGEYHKALGFLYRELTAITTFDPEAVVVVMADHGPHILGDATYPYYTMEASEITELHMIDTFGVAMAVRWPDPVRAAKYDKDIIISQNIFPVVLAYLFDSPVPLQYKIDDTLVWMRGHEYDRGVFYPNAYETSWELGTPGAEILEPRDFNEKLQRRDE